MKISLFSIALIVFCQFSYSKTLICTLTLGSSNEKEAMQKFLSLPDIEFKELVEFGNEEYSKKDAWFSKACESKIKCDVLLISAHFSEGFYGGKFFLDLNELKQRSCDNSCPGILEHPKEVHILGCGSLESNGSGLKPNETEGYATSLKKSLFSENYAAQITQVPYRKIGFSSSDNFQQIFFNTPRIFGYTTLGPLGKQIESAFISYAKSTQDYYLNLPNLKKSDLLMPNLSYLSTVGKKSPLVQVYGSDFHPQPTHQLVCDSIRPSTPTEERLASVSALMQKDPFHFLEVLQDAIKEIEKSDDKDETKNEIKNRLITLLKNKTNLLDQFADVFKTSRDFKASISTGEILFYLDQITEAEYAERVKFLYEKLNEGSKNPARAAGQFFSDLVYRASRNLINPSFILLKLVNDQKLSEIDVFTLRHVSEISEPLQKSLFQYVKSSALTTQKKEGLETLSTHKITSAEILHDMIKMFFSDQSTEIRRYLIKALGKARSEKSDLDEDFEKIKSEILNNPILKFEFDQNVDVIEKPHPS